MTTATMQIHPYKRLMGSVQAPTNISRLFNIQQNEGSVQKKSRRIAYIAKIQTGNKSKISKINEE